MDLQLIRAYCVEDLKGILRERNWSSSPEGRVEELLILLEKLTKGVRHLQPRQYAALQCLLSVELLAHPYEADPTTPEFTETAALEHSRERLTEKLQAYVLHLSPDEAAPLLFPKEQAKQTGAGGRKWIPEKLAELKAYREAHTMPETAEKFGITEQRIRQLLPSQKNQSEAVHGLVHRIK